MRIAGMKHTLDTDGPGLRFVVLLQGCEHKCPGCYDPAAQEGGGVDFSMEELVLQMLSEPAVVGLTIAGGEPFAQAEDCAALAREARQAGLNVWCRTGTTFELLRDHGLPFQKDLLNEIDVLADTPADMEVPAVCGETGPRRLVLVKESLQSGNTVLMDNQ